MPCASSRPRASTSLPFRRDHRPAAMDQLALAAHEAALGHDRRGHSSASSPAWCSPRPAFSVEWAAQAMAESRIVAVQPPWIVPSGLKKRAEGVPVKTTRPSSTSARREVHRIGEGRAGMAALDHAAQEGQAVLGDQNLACDDPDFACHGAPRYRVDTR